MTSHSAGVAPHDGLIAANGVNAATGEYLLPPQRPEAVCAVAAGSPLPERELQALQAVHPGGEPHLGVIFGVDPARLESAGWGVVFASDATAETREALAPLLARRREEAGDLYREFAGEDGYRRGEEAGDFLARYGAGLGPVNPRKVPYYLLLVGDPETIPYEFQYHLDVIHAVGRIAFDTVEEYARYAASVVEAETGAARRRRTLRFFGPRNANDRATQLSCDLLVSGLEERFRQPPAGWSAAAVKGDDATRARLGELVGGAETPAVLFTASHGIGFPRGHPLQATHQGALLCQDWPGPLAKQPGLPPGQYFSADDLSDAADVAGMIVFAFACYGGGTPSFDDFASGEAAAKQLADRPFVARLPQRLLAHPRGGALAVIAHVDRAWGYSFLSPQAGEQIESYCSTIEGILAGRPVGAAVDYFNEYYAAVSTRLTSALDKRRKGMRNDAAVAGLWTANHDARNYVVLGDPAVRLRPEQLAAE